MVYGEIPRVLWEPWTIPDAILLLPKLALRQLVRHHPGEDPALHDLAETWPFFMGEMLGKMAAIF